MTMRRGLLILVLGLAACGAAFYCVYRMGTATPRALLQSPQPKLAQILGCAVKAVEARIYRARKQLRTALNCLLKQERA